MTRDLGKFIYCLAVLALSLSLNVILGWKLREQGGGPTVGAEIPVGTTLPQLAVKDLDGSPATITFDHAGWAVLYVMAPDCPFCAENQKTIGDLSTRATPRLRFVGLSLTNRNLKPFLANHPAAFPVYQAGDPQYLYGLAFRVIPQTILISPTGVVQKVWAGRLSEAQSVYKELRTLIDSPVRPDLGVAR